jgi:hypothetical protein
MKTEIGYYSANGINFSTNKVAAILEAQRTGTDIKWHYHDDILNSVDWTLEPTASLDQLYKIRAQQIRDAYDYVIVFCSGGADSTNVIRTFMDNNIHVDEVVAMIPESGIKNWDWDDKNVSPTNIMSETKYAQYPILHEVSVRKPETKITITDIFKDMLNVESDAWIYESEGDMMDLGNYSYGKLDSLPYLVDMAEKGVRIAAVWGTDKPIITIRDNDILAATLVDSPIYLPKYPFKNVYPNVDRVLFYWTQDMPQLMIKQAHVVAREMLKPENAIIYQACMDLSKQKQQTVAGSADDILNNFKNPTIKPAGYYSPKTVFQRGVVPFIYSATWTNKVFQVNKFELSQTFLPAFSNWMPELHSGSRLIQLIESDFKSFYSKISPKYLNPSRTGFKVCVKLFPIGNKNNFIKQK